MELHLLEVEPVRSWYRPLSQCSNSQPLIVKHDHRNSHRLGTYIKCEIPCDRESKNKDPDFPYICHRMVLVHSTNFLFTFCRPPDDRTIMFDKIAEKIDDIHLEKLSTEVLPAMSTSDYSDWPVLKVMPNEKYRFKVLLHRTIFQYTKADSFRSHIADVPLSAFFKYRSPSLNGYFLAWKVL